MILQLKTLLCSLPVLGPPVDLVVLGKKCSVRMRLFNGCSDDSAAYKASLFLGFLSIGFSREEIWHFELTLHIQSFCSLKFYNFQLFLLYPARQPLSHHLPNPKPKTLEGLPWEVLGKFDSLSELRSLIIGETPLQMREARGSTLGTG